MLTPMIILLFTPWPSPSGAPLVDAGPTLPVPDAVVDGGGGIYDFGLPDKPVNGKLSFPKSTAANAVTDGVDQTALDPEATVLVRVLVTTLCETVCSEAGQFTSPWDLQATILYVIFVVVVVVDMPSSRLNASPDTAGVVTVVVAFLLVIHAAARVV